MVVLFGMEAKDNVREILMYANRNYDEEDIRWEWGYIMSEYCTHTKRYTHAQMQKLLGTFPLVFSCLGCHWGIRNIINKKVHLRERKRHTAGRVSSTLSAVPFRGGLPHHRGVPHSWPGGTPSQGVPPSPSQDWGTPHP